MVQQRSVVVEDFDIDVDVDVPDFGVLVVHSKPPSGLRELILATLK